MTIPPPGYWLVSKTRTRRILVGMAEGDVIGFVTGSGAPHVIRSWAGRLYPSEGGMGGEIHLVCQAVGRRASRNKFSRSVTFETVVFTRVTAELAGGLPEAGTLTG